MIILSDCAYHLRSKYRKSGRCLMLHYLPVPPAVTALRMDFLRQQGLLVDVGKHQLIMTAYMKVIRAVAPSGGPGGLYTAVAFPSAEYGPLFAEYVTQHKEESGKHQLIMTASMKVIRVMAHLAASPRRGRPPASRTRPRQSRMHPPRGEAG